MSASGTETVVGPGGLRQRRRRVAAAALGCAGLLGVALWTVPSTSAGSSQNFSSVVPARLLDSRTDGATSDGAFVNLGVRPSGSVTELPVAGRGGVAGGASAAVLNVTVTDSVGEGYVTVFPCGSPRPLASSVNFVSGVTVANGVFARIGAGGKVCLFVSQASHLIVDVTGYFPSSAFSSLVPARLLDTRPDGATVDGAFAQTGLPAAGSVTALTVAGRGGVVGDATTAVLNVTVTDAVGDGYVTVFPCGSPRPLASTVNFVTGVTAANGVVARIGTAGQVCLFTSNAAHLIVDVNGNFPRSAAFSSLVPARVLDTRADGQTADGAYVNLGVRPGGSVTQIPVAGRGGAAANASAVVLNVTATESEGEGYVTVFPCGSPRPLASSLNFAAGVTVANAVVARVGTAGSVCLFVSVSTHLIVDVSGYFEWNGSGSGSSNSVDIPTSDDIPLG